MAWRKPEVTEGTLDLKTKICLVGEKGVGKTSLIRRFVLDQFDDAYVRTLGAKVSKKTLRVAVPERHTQVAITMAIWDVIGHPGFRQILGDSFFLGAHGIVAVVDVTRRETLSSVSQWTASVEGIAGKVPIVLAANKVDLKSELARDEVASMARTLDCDHVFTSAKTGENVEAAFLRLGTTIARATLARRGTAPESPEHAPSTPSRND